MTGCKPPHKPDFDEFCAVFFETTGEVAGRDIDKNADWLSLDEATRSMVLAMFKDLMESRHGFELVVEPQLVTMDIPLESVAIQLYHVFSNVHLMERINAKIKNRFN